METEKAYEIIRSRISTEHGLAVSRIGWLIASQGLLLATLQIISKDNSVFNILIPILGLVLSTLTTILVWLTTLTMDAWKDKERSLFVNADQKFCEAIATNRPRWVHKLSMYLTVAIPSCMIVFWLVAITAALF